MAPPPVQGIAFPLYPDRAEGARARRRRRLAEIADTGANAVAIVVTWAQRDVAASSIRPTDETARDAVVERAIRTARDRGLRVLLFPILTVERTRPGEWRGTLRPDDVSAWWASYERFILHYAAIASNARADGLLVGSELGTTEAWKGRWYHLISRVERTFDGLLAYSANWDHFRSVSFWNRVDVIGVTGYFELTRDADAGIVDLVRGWIRAREALVAFARERDKPLWITEVGYPSRDGAAIWPWDYAREAPVDLEEQRRAYRAFVIAWGGIRDLGGVFFWNWFGAGGPGDRDYTPRDKPAEDVLRRWFHRADDAPGRGFLAPGSR